MSGDQSLDRSIAYPQKPGMVQAIAIMCLVDGILNLLWAVALPIILVSGVVTALCIPISVYPFVLGLLEIIHAARLLSEPVGVQRPAQYLAVMQIVNIVVGNLVSLIIGILSLVFYSDSRVRAYFRTISASFQAYASRV